MVKQAEKIEKRNPLLPIFGIVIAVGLGVVAYLLMDIALKAIPQLGTAVNSMGSQIALGRFGIAFSIWVILVGIAYFLVAVLTGTDPESAKANPLPPRQVKKKR